MVEKPLVSVVEDKVVQVKPMPAFWAVMLTGRDTQSMVNMRPHHETYNLSNPATQDYGGARIMDRMFVKLPFLTAARDIEPGELLVLPFDGGMGEIMCENFPPTYPGYQPRELCGIQR